MGVRGHVLFQLAHSDRQRPPEQRGHRGKGSTPDTNVNECGEFCERVSRNCRNAVRDERSARTEMISRGMLLNVQIATSQSQAIVCALGIPAWD